MTHHTRPTALLALLILAGAARAAGTPGGLPTPGNYRVDSESTRTTQGGMAELTVVQRTDGATGQITVTRNASTDPDHAVTQVIPGDKPVLRCFVTAAAPPWAQANACPGMSHTVNTDRATLQGRCNGQSLDDQWTRIDDRTWEHVLRVENSSASTGFFPPSANGMTVPGMTAAQQAQMQAQTSGAQQAVSDLRQRLETAARGSDPKQAAAARQALAAMGAGSGSGIVDVLKERWTRVAESCPAPR